jgi:hypothetical protein
MMPLYVDARIDPIVGLQISHPSCQVGGNIEDIISGLNETERKFIQGNRETYTMAMFVENFFKAINGSGVSISSDKSHQLWS